MLPASSIAIIGAGAFGTALAIQLARGGAPALLWGRDADAVEAIGAARENRRYLPGCPLPPSLTVTSDLVATVAAARDLLIATPSAALRQICVDLAPLLRPEQALICAAKGLEPGSGRFAHEVVAEVLGPDRPLAVLSGPAFAGEIGRGLLTAVTLASTHPGVIERTAKALHSHHFRPYSSTDVIGVEIGGAAKNVLAIGVGIADGMGLGANTRTALITRGLQEIARLGASLGARPETLMGLSGLGDLVLTCTDNQSRNRRFGMLLGRGRTTAEALSEIGSVVEGLRAAPEVLRLARRQQVELPLCEHMDAVLGGRMTPLQALQSLAERPLRSEFDAH